MELYTAIICKSMDIEWLLLSLLPLLLLYCVAQSQLLGTIYKCDCSSTYINLSVTFILHLYLQLDM